MKPLLSTVIVNSDGCADTLNCLESLFAHPPDLATLAPRADALPEHEIILVDNRSRDGCVALVRERFPSVRIIESPVRQGFSKNYNLGIRHSHGTFVLVLNNDTIVHPGALTALLDAIMHTPTYGMVGGRLIGRNGWVQETCARPVMTPVEHLLRQTLIDPGFPVGRLWQFYQQIRVARRRSGSVPCIGEQFYDRWRAGALPERVDPRIRRFDRRRLTGELATIFDELGSPREKQGRRI
ncbi:glycosyltransferase [Roseiflexus sp.]|uniref:glycosyltransferase n=1 Tax=Roseiflexus sp. TaxID=2562120 RepID=UPI00398BAA39